MESVVVACITDAVTLIKVILSNTKSHAVMVAKLDALTEKAGKHNHNPGAHKPSRAGHGRRDIHNP